jgi:AraC-like DNA-binding protein
MHISFSSPSRTNGAAEAVNLPVTEPTVRASILAALPDYLSAYGVDIRSLLREAGITPAAIDQPDLQISLNSTGRLFELAARRLGDKAFGLSYAQAFPPGASGLLGHLVMSAPTVRDVFHVIARFIGVQISPVEPEFEVRDGGVGWFSLTWPCAFTEPQLHYTGFLMSSLVLRLRRATGPNWVPLAVMFQHRVPDEIEPYKQFFGSRMKFDQRSNSLAVDATTLALPMPEILPNLHTTMQKLGEHHLHERDLKEQTTAEDTASRLRRLLAQRLGAEEAFDLDSVAAAMGTQSRGLQWRLEQAATTYEKILLQTRIDMAGTYLRETDHQLTKIASLLGFSELSAFTRWCGKQFHMTPSAYRRHLRRGGHPVTSPADDPS